jgi:hypothetical protein
MKIARCIPRASSTPLGTCLEMEFRKLLDAVDLQSSPWTIVSKIFN